MRLLVPGHVVPRARRAASSGRCRREPATRPPGPLLPCHPRLLVRGSRRRDRGELWTTGGTGAPCGQALPAYRGGPCPSCVDLVPLRGAQRGQGRGEDSVLLLDDVLAEHDQGLLEPPGPERVAWGAVRRLGEDLLDPAVLVDQAGDVVAEVLDHRGKERALLDGRVRPQDGDDTARSVGREVEVAGPEGTSDLSGQGHDDVVLGRQLSDRVQVLASAVVAH